MIAELDALLNRVATGMTTESDAETLHRLIHPTDAERVVMAYTVLVSSPDVVLRAISPEMRHELAQELVADL